VENFSMLCLLNRNGLLYRFFRLFSTRETFLRLMSENLLNKVPVVAARPFGGEVTGR
jgi:hypothetical protein